MNANQTPPETCYWLITFGVVTLLACVLVLVSDVVGCYFADQHNPISETISKLAVGDHAWVQDYGLNMFALGIATCAIGLGRWNHGGWQWRVATGLLVLIAIDILVISEYDQYKGFDGFGATIHLTCVYILYMLVAAASLLLAFELGAVHPHYRWRSYVFAAIWLVGCPIFLFASPTNIDGAIERLLAIALVAWIAMLAWLVLQKGRGRIVTNETPLTDEKARSAGQ